MRAHLVRGLLAGHGLAVDVVTTSEAGQAFLAGLGTPAALLPGGFALLFDDCHRLRAGATERHLAAYLASPHGLARDVAHLARLGAGARFIVNDSLHPAALALAAAPRFARAPRVVDLHGDNLWRATAHTFDRRLPDWASRAFRRTLQAADARAFGRIVHSLAPRDRFGRRDGRNRFRLPPLLAPPRRSRAAVRDALGLADGDRLAAIYLNPHFRDPSIAAGLEAALASAGLRFAGISEPWAGRPGWRAVDPHFGDVIAAADLFVSGAGAGALEHARRAAVPLIALVGAQPEQALNLKQARAAGVAVHAVDTRTLADLPQALASLMNSPSHRRDAAGEHARVRRLWSEALLSLAAHPKEDDHAAGDDIADHRPGARDQQPAGRPRRSRHDRTEPRPPAHATARADAPARVAR
ncbi:MAG TPA: hypothetical protein VIF57_22575 [Polyangia bacterium]|jgi:hypothetical protein